MKGPARKLPAGEEHLRRVRRLCSALPETTEKVSHGEPTFFVNKKVYAMFVNNHHDDGHIAVWLPVLAFAVLGVWLFLFVRQLRSRSLLPLNDPFFKKEFAHEAH